MRPIFTVILLSFAAVLAPGCGADPAPRADPGSPPDHGTGTDEDGSAPRTGPAAIDPGPAGSVGDSVGASTAPAEPSSLVRAMRAGETEHEPADRASNPVVGETTDENDAQSDAESDENSPSDQAQPAAPPESLDPDAPATAPPPEPDTYPVDGMVGQVNGNAIYASKVFEPSDQQLAALGRELPRAAFRERAKQIIQSRIRQTVIDALILGEAERDLSGNERRGLRHLTQLHREELLRKYGQGSVSLAEKNIQDATDKSLAQNLADYRQTQIVQRYLGQKLYPKINVTRRDVERYYQDHREEFQPRSTRDVRLIRVNTPAAAEHVQEALAAGRPFAQVATDPANTFKRSDGGLLENIGKQAFSQDQLNQAVQSLNQGQHSEAIEIGDQTWFVYVDRATNPKGESLMEAQRDIENKLRAQQFRVLSDRYRQRLLREGSYNPVDEMVDALVEIAVSRYAAPEDNSGGVSMRSGGASG